MKSFDCRSVVAGATLALLAACGGSPLPAQGDLSSSAAVAMHGPAPQADCETDGCTRPRIIDGLAEQYRAAASEQADVQAGAVSEPAPR